MKNFVAIALLSTALVSGAAIAQTAQPADRAGPAATKSPASSEKMLKLSNRVHSRIFTVSKGLLDLGLSVVSPKRLQTFWLQRAHSFVSFQRNPLRQHDIAVTMDKLKFVEEPVRTSSTAPATTTRETTTGTSTAPATTTTTTATTVRSTDANDWTPDHAVMSGTKEQLKALPQFKYSDYN